MSALLLELGRLACFGALAFFCMYGWAAFLDQFASCPDCRKGALCARCLAESEAIRPGGGS